MKVHKLNRKVNFNISIQVAGYVNRVRPFDKCLTRFTSAPRSLTPKQHTTNPRYLITYSDPAADKCNDVHQIALFKQNVVTLLVKLSLTKF